MDETISRSVLVNILLNFFYFYCNCDQISEPVVVTKQGAVQGKIANGVNGQNFFSFQGIPYAEPPIGELRFKAPIFPKPWKGILDATKEKDECYATHFFGKIHVGSENCLYLNVYTPKIPQNENNTLLPVMVWIHGGGFTVGSSKTEIYGPEYLIYQNVVLVTFNYRLGCLGFLSLEDSSLDVPGNAGIKDQILAFQWVQKNIAAFGGNPNDVTAFGQSAGAASVHILMLSPTSQGLFHKAIMESGSVLNYWAKGRRYAKQLAKNLGFETEDEAQILNFLRQHSVEDLVAAQEKIRLPTPKNIPSLNGLVIEKSLPSNGPHVLTQEPLEMIRSGNYTKIPLLMGYNNLEGMLAEVNHGENLTVNFEWQVPYALNLEEDSESYKEVARRIRHFYYGIAEPTKENLNIYFMLLTDIAFGYAVHTSAKLHAATSTAPVYFYRFAVDAKLNLIKTTSGVKIPGACHSDELGYIFKTEVLNSTVPEGTVEDITIKRLAKLWTNFAKYGDPNPKDRDELIDVVWEPIKNDNEVFFLEIGNKLSTGVNPDAERMAFWDSIYNFRNASSKTCTFTFQTIVLYIIGLQIIIKQLAF